MILWIINPQFGYLNPIVCFIPTTIIAAIIAKIFPRTRFIEPPILDIRATF